MVGCAIVHTPLPLTAHNAVYIYCVLLGSWTGVYRKHDM